MSDAGLQDVRVGDTVMVSTYGRKHTAAEVVKVARKYLTTTDGQQFEIATGRWNSDYSGIALTPQQLLARQDERDLIVALRNLGIEVTHRARLSVDQLRSLLEVAHDE